MNFVCFFFFLGINLRIAKCDWEDLVRPVCITIEYEYDQCQKRSEYIKMLIRRPTFLELFTLPKSELFNIIFTIHKTQLITTMEGEDM
jgi:hypothetical protein